VKHDSLSRLTPAEIAKLRERLLLERSRLRGGAEGALATVREPRERSADDVDEAEESLVEHEALGLADHDGARLALVDRALEKIDAHSYGVSELSGEPIGYARLAAVPWARFTAAEQEEVEHMDRR
jgi:DnaK suppressor protein